MSAGGNLLERVEAVNVGLAQFGEAVRAQGGEAVDVDWRPPSAEDGDSLAALEALWGRHGERVAQANAEAVERIEAASPRAVGVAPATEVIDAFEGGRVLLHSGPPIEWDRVCNPQRRALAAACLFEGWADEREAAGELLGSGDVELRSGNDCGHAGAMTGVCSPSMPVWVVEDERSAARAHSTLSEGPGRTLWLGVGDDEAVERLRFFRDELGPLLAECIERLGPIDVFGLAAQGVQMGDDVHMRSQATGALLLRELLPALAGRASERSGRFLSSNHHLFLTLAIAGAKCASLAAGGSEGASIVTLISRNGTDVGVQVAGLEDRWFTAPAAPVQDALLREGFEADDAALDIGDSAVIECVGLGGAALAAAPAVAAFFGGTTVDAVERTRLTGEVSVARSRRFTIPLLDSEGTPVGIDARLVSELEITPQVSTGVLHRSSGAGQIGAGIARQPVQPFRAATVALARELDGEAEGG